MSLSVVAALQQLGKIDRDWLAHSFAERYDPQRGYGPSMHRHLGEVRAGGNWWAVAPRQFGGQGSFGNGAVMRAAPLGAFFADDLELVAGEAERSSIVTHTHPEAVAGAVAVAEAGALAWRAQESGRMPATTEFLGEVAQWVPQGQVREGILRARSR